MKSLSLKTLIGLILCNFIWSFNPALSKILLGQFSPLQTAWLRYTSALLSLTCFLCFFFIFKFSLKNPAKVILPQLNAFKKNWHLLLLMSFFVFCYSPLLQITGLSFSRATDNALIIAMEPLMTVGLAWMILRERLCFNQVLAFGLAMVGFFLLSDFFLNRSIAPQHWKTHFLGNLFILMSLFGEATYSIFSRKLFGHFSPLTLFGTILIISVGMLTLILISTDGIPTLQFVNLKSGLVIFYLGALGTTATYLYWMLALQEAPIARLALTLFIQPLCGALWGIIFLNEKLSALQLTGGVLILTAVFSQNDWRTIMHCKKN